MSISFNKLGSYGRLGNQMFQYASLKGIARNNDLDFCIPYSVEVNEWYDHMLAKHFVLDKSIKMISVEGQNQYQERFFHFDKMLFENCPDNTDLMGYFQSYRYFDGIREEIVADFAFREKFEKPLPDYTAVHVRRGDYLNQPQYHPVCSVEYYENALDLTGGPVVVMSDDIEWCKKFITADLYLDGTSNIYDLFVMTQARDNIIANSSFSWWGAWLNKNESKIVVAPKNWFGEAYAHYDMSDLRPQEWYQI